MTFVIGFIVIIIVLAFSLAALVSVWVYRDAKSRGLNAGLWALVTLLGQIPLGLLVYLLAGRKDAPVVTNTVRARPYIIAGVLCFLLLIGTTVGFAIYSVSGDFSGLDWSYSTGMMESSWDSEWTMRFNYSNKSSSKRISVPEGTALTAEASCAEGTITLMVTADGFSELYRLSEGETVDITFPPDSGKTKTAVGLYLDCTKARDGDVRIKWK